MILPIPPIFIGEVPRNEARGLNRVVEITDTYIEILRHFVPQNDIYFATLSVAKGLVASFEILRW